MSASKWKPYPEYSESELGGIGKIPKTWDTIPLWVVFKRTKRTNCPEEELLSVYRDYGVIPKSSRDDNFNKASLDLNPYQLVNIGDLVINKMKAWQGSIAISQHRGIVSPAYHVYTPFHDLDERYLHHLLRSTIYITLYGSISKGIRVGQWDLEPEEFRKLNLLSPPQADQKKIGKYLDKSLTDIEKLIESLSEFILKLKEKRASLITRAVTKGLNPNAPMKDSGINYIGKIPKHWNVYPLGRICSKIQNGSTPPTSNTEYYEKGDISWYGPSSFSDEINIGKPVKKISKLSIDDGVARKFSANTVMIVGIGGTLGKSCFVDHPSSCNQQITVLEMPTDTTNSKFIAYQMKARENYLSGIAPSTTLPQMNNTDLAMIFNAHPSLIEQNKIADFLDSKCSIINNIISKVNEQCENINEYRTALISAAVIGKIDVRTL